MSRNPYGFTPPEIERLAAALRRIAASADHRLQMAGERVRLYLLPGLAVHLMTADEWLYAFISGTGRPPSKRKRR